MGISDETVTAAQNSAGKKYPCYKTGIGESRIRYIILGNMTDHAQKKRENECHRERLQDNPQIT